MVEQSTDNDDNSLRQGATSPAVLRREYQQIEPVIRTFAKKGLTPAQIHGALQALADKALFIGRVPTLRTIERYARSAPMNREESDEAWRPVDADYNEAALVLPVLGYVIWSTDGRIKSITKREAEWIAHVLRMVPELAQPDRDSKGGIPGMSLAVFLIALDYAERESTGEPTEELDLFLALGPWRSDEAREHYSELVERGFVPPARHSRFLDSHISPVQEEYLTKREIEAIRELDPDGVRGVHPRELAQIRAEIAESDRQKHEEDRQRREADEEDSQEGAQK